MFNTLQLSALVGVTPDKDSLDSPGHQITPWLTLRQNFLIFWWDAISLCPMKNVKLTFSLGKRVNLDSLGMQKRILELIKIVYKIC